jgi:hypothetical protein
LDPWQTVDPNRIGKNGKEKKKTHFQFFFMASTNSPSLIKMKLDQAGLACCRVFKVFKK